MNKPSQYLTFLGMLFILISFRQYVSPFWEIVAEITLFLSLVANIVALLKQHQQWLAYAMYVLALFYNPLFLIYHNVPVSMIADMIVGISLIIFAMMFNKKIFTFI